MEEYKAALQALPRAQLWQTLERLASTEASLLSLKADLEEETLFLRSARKALREEKEKVENQLRLQECDVGFIDEVLRDLRLRPDGPLKKASELKPQQWLSKATGLAEALLRRVNSRIAADWGNDKHSEEPSQDSASLEPQTETSSLAAKIQAAPPCRASSWRGGKEFETCILTSDDGVPLRSPEEECQERLLSLQVKEALGLSEGFSFSTVEASHDSSRRNRGRPATRRTTGETEGAASNSAGEEEVSAEGPGTSGLREEPNSEKEKTSEAVNLQPESLSSQESPKSPPTNAAPLAAPPSQNELSSVQPSSVFTKKNGEENSPLQKRLADGRPLDGVEDLRPFLPPLRSRRVTAALPSLSEEELSEADSRGLTKMDEPEKPSLLCTAAVASSEAFVASTKKASETENSPEEADGGEASSSSTREGSSSQSNSSCAVREAGENSREPTLSCSVERQPDGCVLFFWQLNDASQTNVEVQCCVVSSSGGEESFARMQRSSSSPFEIRGLKDGCDFHATLIARCSDGPSEWKRRPICGASIQLSLLNRQCKDVEVRPLKFPPPSLVPRPGVFPDSGVSSGENPLATKLQEEKDEDAPVREIQSAEFDSSSPYWVSREDSPSVFSSPRKSSPRECARVEAAKEVLKNPQEEVSDSTSFAPQPELPSKLETAHLSAAPAKRESFLFEEKPLLESHVSTEGRQVPSSNSADFEKAESPRLSGRDFCEVSTCSTFVSEEKETPKTREALHSAEGERPADGEGQGEFSRLNAETEVSACEETCAPLPLLGGREHCDHSGERCAATGVASLCHQRLPCQEGLGKSVAKSSSFCVSSPLSARRLSEERLIARREEVIRKLFQPPKNPQPRASRSLQRGGWAETPRESGLFSLENSMHFSQWRVCPPQLSSRRGSAEEFSWGSCASLWKAADWRGLGEAERGWPPQQAVAVGALSRSVVFHPQQRAALPGSAILSQTSQRAVAVNSLPLRPPLVRQFEQFGNSTLHSTDAVSRSPFFGDGPHLSATRRQFASTNFAPTVEAASCREASFEGNFAREKAAAAQTTRAVPATGRSASLVGQRSLRFPLGQSEESRWQREAPGIISERSTPSAVAEKSRGAKSGLGESASSARFKAPKLQGSVSQRKPNSLAPPVGCLWTPSPQALARIPRSVPPQSVSTKLSSNFPSVS